MADRGNAGCRGGEEEWGEEANHLTGGWRVLLRLWGQDETFRWVLMRTDTRGVSRLP